MDDLILRQKIEGEIYFIRGQRVMLDRDLAELYGVTTKRLNEQVRRNISRFPEDFMFQLTKEEYDILKCQFDTSNLRSQFATSKERHGGRRYLPYVFTEQGVAMLSSVLNSERAIRVNIQIMRTFTKLRSLLLTHKDLQRKIEEMEKKYDQQFRVVFDAIKALLQYPEPKKKAIGFLREGPIKYKTKNRKK